MQPKIFSYRGFVIKIMAHVLPTSMMATLAPLKYVASIAIIKPGEGRLTDHTHWVHPKGFYATQEEVFEFGGEYAIHLINDGFDESVVK